MIKPQGLNIIQITGQNPGYPTLYNVYIRDNAFIGFLTCEGLTIVEADFTLLPCELEYLADFMEKLKAQPSQPNGLKSL